MNCPTCDNPMTASATMLVMDTRCATGGGRVADCACTGAVRLRCLVCRAELIAPTPMLGVYARYILAKAAA